MGSRLKSERPGPKIHSAHFGLAYLGGSADGRDVLCTEPRLRAPGTDVVDAYRDTCQCSQRDRRADKLAPTFAIGSIEVHDIAIRGHRASRVRS
jgi:hypothetical protein